MRRVPIHFLLAVAGLLLVSASVLTLLAADPQQQSADSLVPTVAAMLTQMPPDAVLAQLAAMGYTISPEMQATGQALLQQMPPDAVISLLLANAANPAGQPAPEQPAAAPVILQPTVVSQVIPVQPTLAFTPASIVEPVQPTVEVTAQVMPEQPQLPTAEVPAEAQPEQPTVIPDNHQPPADQPVTPESLSANQPPEPGIPATAEATAALGDAAILQPAPEATEIPATDPLPSPVPVGHISGSVQRAVLPDASGTALVLTRPDGTTLNLPANGDGSFAFSNMEPGTYSLQASAAGFLTGQTSFVLEAGQTLVLPAVTLPGGDTNGDNLIDLADAVLLAANFDSPPPVPEADLNGDGWIDIRDLALLGNAFGLAGPLPWD